MMNNKTRKICDEAFYLTRLELTILLNAAGITSLHGHQLLQEKQDRETCMYALREMANKGIIIPKGTHFVVQETYRQMVRCIETSSATLAIRFADDEKPDYCLYGSAQDLLECEISKRRKNSLLLRFLNRETQLPVFLSGCLPDAEDKTLPTELTERAWTALLQEYHTCTRVADPVFSMGIDIFKKGIPEPENTILILRRKEAYGSVIFRYPYQTNGAETYDKEAILAYLVSILT